MTNQIHIGGGGWLYLIEITEHVYINELNTRINASDESFNGSLCISKTNITTEIYDNIDAIIKQYNIWRLALASCTIGDVSKLMSMVLNTTLYDLYMINCGDIDDRSLAYISEMLSMNTQLTLLRLSGNRINTDGFRSIMRSMIISTTIKELIITGSYTHPHNAVNIIIETIPHIKSLRRLTLPGRSHCTTNEMYDALEKNYSIENFYNGFVFAEMRNRINMIVIRNKYIRVQALRELIDIAIILVPIIRMHHCFDAYCMMWIFDYVNAANIHVSEFKKIRIIKSVFEFYRRKIHNEQSVSAVSLCS